MTAPLRLAARIGAHPPDAIALIVAHADGDERIDYRTLLEGADGWAARLAGHGLVPGDTIALWLPNIAAWPMLELAAARLGLIVVPINTRWKATELRHALAISGARLIVMPEAFCDIPFETMLAEALAGLTPITAIRIPLRAVRHDSVSMPPAAKGDLPLNLLATSGSTGAPKFAVHRQSALVIRFAAAAERFTVRAGDSLLCVLPLCGVWGLGITLAGLLRGATCVLMPVFAPDQAAAVMGRLAITHLHGGDNLILSLLASPELASELPAWRTCYFGAFTGRTGAETIAMIESKGSANLRAAQAYGSSEGLAFVTGSAPSAPLAERAMAGGPLVDDATALRIVDGELQLRGPTVTLGYFRDDAASDRAFTSDGWYRTGDLGHAVPGGGVFLSRMGDALRLRGNLVDASEIEHHLCAHPDIVEAHVVGASADSRGDVAFAFVKLCAGSRVTEPELLAFARLRMANYKLPERILTDVEIPVTIGANGAKVKKSELRAIAQGYLRTPLTT
ncbi:AMP-binding protein [Sphingomonas sp.]|uniref:AMP-binding protein n=1 Tax=Sphingomonas sp. TaxID=28214 RepID=UPI0025E450BF|nr:AMP-binding protein [Sphingomonas sp.]